MKQTITKNMFFGLLLILPFLWANKPIEVSAMVDPMPIPSTYEDFTLTPQETSVEKKDKTFYHSYTYILNNTGDKLLNTNSVRFTNNDVALFLDAKNCEYVMPHDSTKVEINFYSSSEEILTIEPANCMAYTGEFINDFKINTITEHKQSNNYTYDFYIDENSTIGKFKGYSLLSIKYSLGEINDMQNYALSSNVFSFTSHKSLSLQNLNFDKIFFCKGKTFDELPNGTGPSKNENNVHEPMLWLFALLGVLVIGVILVLIPIIAYHIRKSKNRGSEDE